MPTILIVDDRPTNREFLVTLLGYSGHRLLEAADGAEAIAAAEADHVDLIISDILMPTMDGYELVRRLRADPAHVGTPVIFCTAHYHEEEARNLAKSCGVSHVLFKPCEPEDVLRTVDAALGVAAQRAAFSTSEDFDREHLRLLTDKLAQKSNELRRTNERLSELVELGTRLGSELDPATLLQDFCHAARRLVGARYAVVGIVNGADAMLRFSFISGMDAEIAARFGVPDPTRGGIASVLAESRCLRLQNPGGDPENLNFPAFYPPLHAWLGAPILSPKRVHGWLGLIDKVGAEGFSDEDERLAGILAAQVGRIYENGSLYADLVDQTAALAERARLASLVADVGTALTMGRPTPETLNSCASALVSNLDAAFARIWTVDGSGAVLELRASAGLYTHTDGPHSRVPVGKLKIGLIAEERKPHLTNDVLADPRIGDPEWARREGMVAFAGYPLLVGERLVGVMAMFARQPLSNATLDAMAAISDQIALFIENTQAAEALRASEERVRLLLHSTAEAIYGIDLDGRCTFCNPACLRILGYSEPGHLLGKNMHSLVHHSRTDGTPLPVEECRIFRAFTHGVESHVEDEVLWRLDGSCFPVEYWSYPIRQNGTIVGSVVTFLDITEKKSAEHRQQALARERDSLLRRLQLQIARMPLAYVLFDSQFHIVDWNEAAERTFGYRKEEVLGMGPPLEKILPAETWRELASVRLQIEAGDMTAHSTNMNLTKDGRTIICEWYNTPLMDEDGRFNGLLCLAQNVTKRKYAEQRLTVQHAITPILATAPTILEAGTEILRAVCEGLAWELGALWQVDDAAGVLNCVRTWHQPPLKMAAFEAEISRLPCRPGEGLPGTVWADRKAVWYTDYSRDTNFPHTPLAGTTGVRGAFGFPITLGDDIIGVLEFFSTEARSPDPDVLDMMTALGSQIGQFIDRKRTEEELRVSEERFRQVAENIREVFWLSDPLNNKILYVSPAYETIWGRGCKSLYRSAGDWLEAVHPEDREGVQQAYLTKQAAGKYDEVYRIVRTDGSIRWIHDRAFPVLDAARNVYRVAGVAEDITDRRLLEDQFRQAQKMEAVGRLAGGVAHDFNNLLTVITGYSELVLGQLRPADPLHNFIDQVRQAGERAARLTRQLLAFSRKQVLLPISLDLNSLLAEMEKMLRRLIGEDIDLLVRAHKPLWYVKADAGQIEQVVMNLVVNARDAMPHGGKLTLETANAELDPTYAAQHPEVKSGEYVLLSVSDTGCGMDAATRARIFEPFFSTKGEKGTGLGLATVYGIVKQSGGAINVYSEPGIGTSFKIYLPRELEQQAGPKSSPPMKSPVRGSETVLLAEDENGVRSLAKFVLAASGYTVLEAQNGGEALLLCEQHRGKIDLLVTDVVMPQMSGPQLAERLRAVQPELKVLFLSGYTDDAIVHHGVLTPGTPFLQKPFSPQNLVRKVREVLDG